MKKLKSEDKGLFRNVCTCQVGMGIAMTMIGAVLPQIAGEYGLDYSFSGLMLSVQSAGYFIAGLAAGYLPRYFGARKCYVGLGAMAFIGLWLLMHTSQQFLLLLAMLLTGISKGSGNNFTNQFTANISQGDTGRLNFMHAFYPVGACIAPLLVIACGASWRTAFRIVIVFGVLYLLHAMVMRVSHRASGNAAIQNGKNDYSFFKLKIFWVCAGMMSIYVAFESALSGWLVTYFVNGTAISESTAQIFTTVLWGALCCGRMITARISSRFQPYQMLPMMAVGTLVFFTVLMQAENTTAMVVGTIGTGLCMAGLYGTAMGNSSGIFEKYPLCMGVLVVLPGVFSLVVLAGMGALADCTDIRTGMASLYALLVLMFTLTVWNAVFLRQERKAAATV